MNNDFKSVKTLTGSIMNPTAAPIWAWQRGLGGRRNHGNLRLAKRKAQNRGNKYSLLILFELILGKDRRK